MIKHRRKKLLSLSAALLVAGLFLGVHAGDLEPWGPPGPTMKPLDALEPRLPIWAEMLPLTITEPGSYYLAENVSTPGQGITIESDNVTIDLMGFTLEGGLGTGIWSEPTVNHQYTTVQNGVITGWSGEGIRLSDNATVRNMVVHGNGSNGVELGYAAHVINSNVSNNLVHGIVVGYESKVTDCIASNNHDNGIWGSYSVLITDNVASNNCKNGIRVDAYSMVLNNQADANSLCYGHVKAGIWATGENNRIEGNLVTFNVLGIDVDGDDNVVVRNSAFDNSTLNFDIDPGSSGNMVGTIVSTMSTNDPWCNFAK